MDKTKLLADRVTSITGELDIEGVGTVRFRALTRHEVLEADRLSGGDTLKHERYVLSRAMLDPVLGEDDVAAWQKSSTPLEINGVAMAINALSGIGKGAGKSDLPDVREPS